MIRDSVADWQELSLLYGRAGALDALALEAFLDDLRRSGHRLLPQLVRMLASRAADDDLLGDAPPDATAGDPVAGGSPWSAGLRVGAWRLVRPIGAGTTAEVWLGQRADGALQRRAAIKLLHRYPAGPAPDSGPDAEARREPGSEGFRAAFADAPDAWTDTRPGAGIELPGPAPLEPFRREQSALANLQHPHIAAFLDAGLGPQGRPWLALEYVPGEPVTTWCDRHRFTVAQRVDCFLQVVAAVEYAHAGLVLHRDLKPANIVVSEHGAVKLLDVGIAGLLEAGAGTAYAAISVPLSLPYASPEQVRRRPLTTASDVHALGVVLHELLAGVPPPEAVEPALPATAPRPLRQGVPTAQAALARRTTPPALSRLLGGDLGAVVAKAIARDPAARYPSAEALRRDLERWRRGIPVRARPAGAARRLWQRMRRYPVVSVLAAGAALALAGVTAGALVLGAEARDAAAQAVAARDLALGAFHMADAGQPQGREITLARLLDASRRNAERALQGQPAVLADALAGIGRMQASIGERAQADATLLRVIDLYNALGRARERLFAQADLAFNALQLGQAERAVELTRSTAVGAAAFPQDAALQARVALVEGRALRAVGQLDAARARMDAAFALAVRAHGEADARALQALVGLAEVDASRQDYTAARKWLDDAESRVPRSANLGARDRIAVDIARVRVGMDAGQYGDAEHRAGDAIVRCDRSLGAGSDECQLLRRLSAATLLRAGKPREAFDLVPALLPATVLAGSPGHQAESVIAVARILGANRELARYPGVHEQLQQIGASPSQPVALRAAAHLALAEAALFDADGTRAERHAAAALALDAESPHARWLAGVGLQLRGRDAEAVRAFAEAEARYLRTLPDDHPLVALVRVNGARSQARLGRRADALAACRAALPVLARAYRTSAEVVVRAERACARVDAPRWAETPTPEFFT